MHTLTIPASYLQTRRTWKSEQQHINEFLYRAGLPFRQNDLTNMDTGMKYVGDPAALHTCSNQDGSISVTYHGEVAERRPLPRPKKRVEPAVFQWGGF